MASRSANTGPIAFAVFLGVLWLVFLVLTLTFYSQTNTARSEAEEAEERLARFVSRGERDAADRLADQTSGRSVFGYLDERFGETMSRVTGSANTTYDQFVQRLDQLESDAPLLQQVQQQQRRIAELEAQLEDAGAELAGAIQQLNDQRASVEQIRQQFAQRQQEMQRTVDEYVSRAQEYVGRLGNEEQAMNQRVERIRSDAEADVNRLQEQVNRLREENLVLEGQIQQLRNERRGEQLRGKDEFALVDGQVVAIDASRNEVRLNRGRRDKIVLGMSFAVYGDAAAIRPNAQGEYPPGKAQVEVINVQEDSSTARILRETRGNPVVRGDVIANPVYDPNKTYTFLVFGNFDTNGDGRATPHEAEALEARIREWGGRISEELTGDVDFLVLGQRPLLPPQPSSDAPPPVQLEWIRTSRIVDRYNELQRRAEATGIPVLNQNRLRTLLGNR